MVDAEYKIDDLDRQILRVLTEDARVPYTEMAKNFGVSLGTIHVRIEKMRKYKIIKEIVARVDIKKIGYNMICFLGITLKKLSDCEQVLKDLQDEECIIDMHHTVGKFSIFAKLAFTDLNLCYNFLESLEKKPEIDQLEPIFSMNNLVLRNIKP
ncbi:MAG: AsnC family transcriptional regulator [Psittacicella sp.]